MELITTCSNCGSQFAWDHNLWAKWTEETPDCPACGFNNQTGRKGNGEGPIERYYRKMARDLAEQHGPLRFVEYLSHFPAFEINFVFDKHTVYSGRRRGEYDINFLSLGYVGEGPRYARAFLEELGFSMTSEEIKAIRPGAVLKLEDGKVVVLYIQSDKTKPKEQVRPASPALQQGIQPVQKNMANDYSKKLMSAAYNGNHDAVLKALEDGADVNFIDNRNPTFPAPLLAAIECYQEDRDRPSSLKVIKTLLENGANPNVSNGFNNALKIAAGRGYLDIVELLLKYGVDPTIANRAGETPLSSAEFFGHSKTAEAIRAALMKKEGTILPKTTKKLVPQEQVRPASPALQQGIQPVQKRWWQFWK